MIQRPLQGIVLKLASTVVFAVMLVCIKVVGNAVPPGEVVFFRSLFGAVPVIAMVTWQGQLRASFATVRPVGHMVRSLVGVSTMFLGFAAYQRMPLADALAIGYASPLFVVIIAALTLGERVRIYRLTAVAIGFVGILVVLWPQFGTGATLAGDGRTTGAVLMFISAITGAFAATQIRRLSNWGEQTTTIVVYFSIGCTVASLATIPFGWVMPSPWHLALLVAAGLFGGVGQLLVTRAFALVDTAIVSTLEYISMLWAVLAGWALFGELPDAYVAIGSTIIILSGIVIVWREHRLGLKRGTDAKRTEL